MQQEFEAKLTLIGEVDAEASNYAIGAGIDIERHPDGSLTVRAKGPGQSLRSLAVDCVREEAAIYGTDDPAPAAPPPPAAPAASVQTAPDASAPVYEGTGAPIAEWLQRTNELWEAVDRLRGFYDANPICNEIQPRALGACFAASLDDWAEGILQAEQDLRYLGRFYAGLEARRFSPEFAGAGCTMLSAYRHGAAVWASNKDGGSYPTPEDWNVAVYLPENVGGDPLWNMTSEEGADVDASTARFIAAVDAALATAEALGEA